MEQDTDSGCLLLRGHSVSVDVTNQPTTSYTAARRGIVQLEKVPCTKSSVLGASLFFLGTNLRFSIYIWEPAFTLPQNILAS